MTDFLKGIQPDRGPVSEGPPGVRAPKITHVDGGILRRAMEAMSKGASFARAVASAPASPETVALREKSCYAPCPELDVKEDGKRYCGKCGCGQTPWSELSVKLKMGAVTCPLFRPGFVNAKEEQK